jgi:hypothetical protein
LPFKATITVGISAILAWFDTKMYGRFRSIFSSPLTVTLIPKVHKIHFDHVQGHQRKKSPFLSNGIEANANNESNNETGNRKINFAIVTNNTSPSLQQYL